jgi:hypothetical protein
MLEKNVSNSWRRSFMSLLLVSAYLGLALSPPAPAVPLLRLTDGELPLYELRALDRRVYVLTLDADWERPPEPGLPFHVRLRFPDGEVISQRVLDDARFRSGELRCLIQEYQALRHGLSRGGMLTVTVVAGAGSQAQVVSNELDVRSPLQRTISRHPPERRTARRPRTPPEKKAERLPPGEGKEAPKPPPPGPIVD